jgi:predicted RNA-binding Zn-ribbon protein involved in translation (DUF1610 family)
MAERIKCRGADCNFESELREDNPSILFGKLAVDLYCPNCRNNSLRRKGQGSGYIFVCRSCGEKWSKVPCPKCGTAISGLHSSGGCYVATCVYGSYDCPEVLTLRRFRDDVLSSSFIGRCFIRAYYAVSPKAVRIFGKRKWFHKLFLPILNKLVYMLNRK